MGKDNNRAADRGSADLFKAKGNPFFVAKSVHRRAQLSDVANLGRALDYVLLSGAAIMLGCTRDGGAICLTVLDGADKHRQYCATNEELAEAFAALEDHYQAASIG